MYKIYLALVVLLFGCNSTQVTIDQSQRASMNAILSHSVDLDALDLHYQYLSSPELDGRKYGSVGSKKAQEYLVNRLKQSGIKPFLSDYQHHFKFQKPFKSIEGTNIIGLLPSLVKSDDYIVLTAHYDHLGNGYLGADDNASGTAALLSIAEQLTTQVLNINVIVLFTDAEEAGLLGAKAFAKDHKQVMDSTILNVNMDMLAGSQHSKKLHYIAYGMHKILSDEEVDILKALKKEQTLAIYKGFKRASGALNDKVSWKRASDHGVFYQNKIPFIYYGVGTHVNYHTKKDNYKNSNKDLLKQSTNAIYQHLLYINKAINN